MIHSRDDLRLAELSAEIRQQVLRLQLHLHQQSFLPSIESSLALAASYPEARPLAILLGDKVCGFVLYGIDDETGKWKIFRIYIDKESQARGLGKQATQMLLERLENEHGATEVLLVCNEENVVALRLYRQLGFTECDRKDDKVLLKADIYKRALAERA